MTIVILERLSRMNGKIILVFMIAFIATTCCEYGTTKLFGSNRDVGSPETDAMLIVGIGSVCWTEDILLKRDKIHKLYTTSIMLENITKGTLESQSLSIVSGSIYVFSDLKPGLYRVSTLYSKYLVEQGDPVANPPVDDVWGKIEYELPSSDYPEFMVKLVPGQIEFVGVIYIKSKHPAIIDGALYLDKTGSTYIVQKVFEEYKDGPWGVRLQEKLRENVEAMLFSVSNE
jgi:hypothetical protein